jgi:enoyl-CoA hydratase
MIVVTERDGVAIVTLAHGKANAMDTEFCAAVTKTFVKLRSAKARAVVLTGQDGIFSAGVNLIRARDGGARYMRKFLPVLNKMFDTVFFFEKPVVAAINGHAIAGGCVLACCADMRLMAHGAGRIGVTELLVGLPFPALAFEVMRFVTGPRHFAELIYTGETLPPNEAMERGLLHEVVEPAMLQERALDAARMLAQISPAAFTQTKQQMRLGVTDRIKRDGKRTDAVVTKLWTTPKAIASIDAYVSRTFKKKD